MEFMVSCAGRSSSNPSTSERQAAIANRALSDISSPQTSSGERVCGMSALKTAREAVKMLKVSCSKKCTAWRSLAATRV